MNTTEYRNTSQRKLVKNCGAAGANGSRVWGVVSPLQWGWSWAQKTISILSFEMLNFYAFCTLEQGDRSATVIMMLHHSWYFQRRKYYGPGGWEVGPLHTAQPAEHNATPLITFTTAIARQAM